MIGVLAVDTTAQGVDFDVLGVGRDGGEVVVGLAALAAGKLVVAAVVAGFGFDNQVPTGQGIQKHIDQSGAGNQSTCHTEVGNAGCVPLCCGHTSGGQRQREDDVCNRVDNHVSDDTTQTTQTLDVAASQNGGLLDTTTQLEPHNGVQGDGTEFSQENPDVVSPQTQRLVLFGNPALRKTLLDCKAMEKGIIGRRGGGRLTHAPDGTKTYRP